MQSGAPLFVSASSGRRARAREPENERWRKTDREKKKRAKLEYDSINPAIERVEWQAGGQVGTTERTFHSMNRKEEEMTKGRREREGVREGVVDRRRRRRRRQRRDSARRKVGRLITSEDRQGQNEEERRGRENERILSESLLSRAISSIIFITQRRKVYIVSRVTP